MINSTTRKAEKGLYVELKDYPWLLEDTGVDLVELLFRHMDENEQLWDSVVFENLCSTKRTDDYRLPPFILQSFEAKVLESFKIQWEDKFKENATDNILRPVPYSILLIPRDKCFDENFWFQVDDTLRDVLSGVGPDKDCLYQYWRQFMERAAKLHLAVHPWTERPEVEYLGGGAVTPTFNTVLDEIVYLFCTVGVHGIFSESVEMAVVAASMPCQEENMDQQIGNVFPNDKRNDGSDSEQSSFYVGFASFSIGVILTVLVGLFVSKGNGHLRKRNDLRGIRIPTVEISHDDDETKTDNMEML